MTGDRSRQQVNTRVWRDAPFSHQSHGQLDAHKAQTGDYPLDTQKQECTNIYRSQLTGPELRAFNTFWIFGKIYQLIFSAHWRTLCSQGSALNTRIESTSAFSSHPQWTPPRRTQVWSFLAVPPCQQPSSCQAKIYSPGDRVAPDDLASMGRYCRCRHFILYKSAHSFLHCTEQT